MRSKRIKWLVAGWSALIVLLTVLMLFVVRKDTKDILGKSMSLLATDISQNLELSNEDVAVLKQISYDELVDHPMNVAFEKEARNLMEITDIRYIYLEVPLAVGKYQVELGEEEAYNAPVGTNLSLMFLLDAVANPEDRYLDEGTRPFEDKSRYSIYDVDTKKRHAIRAASYDLVSDKWGRYVSGFAPVYSKEGDYIGLLGVDLDVKAYENTLFRYGLFVLGFTVLNSLAIIYVLALLNQRRKDTKANNYDVLTQTYNRGKIWDVLQHEWYMSKQENKPIGIFLIDIDYFKEYNDYYGHIAGDQVLVKLTEQLKDVITPYTAALGRYSGDRFLCVIYDQLPDEMKTIGAKMVQAVEDLGIEHNESNVTSKITISVGGIVTVPHLHLTPEEAFDMVNNVLYEVKQTARNNCRVKILH